MEWIRDDEKRWTAGENRAMLGLCCTFWTNVETTDRTLGRARCAGDKFNRARARQDPRPAFGGLCRAGPPREPAVNPLRSAPHWRIHVHEAWGGGGGGTSTRGCPQCPPKNGKAVCFLQPKKNRGISTRPSYYSTLRWQCIALSLQQLPLQPAIYDKRSQNQEGPAV